MAAEDFVVGGTAEPESDVHRRKKLSALGPSLRGLYGAVNAPGSDDLSEAPLHGGQVSSTVSAEAGEPSQLATERVERAPSSLEASPLLGGEERLGNALTGEEGSYGPLSGEQRSVSLRRFFKQGGGASSTESASRQAAPTGGQAEDTGGDSIARELGQTRQALGYANTLDKLTGGHFDRTLKNLFKSERPKTEIAPLGGGWDIDPDILRAYEVAGEVPSTGAAFGMPPEAPTEVAGTGGGSASTLGTAASLAGLIATLYSLFQNGAEITPGQALSLAQGVTGLTSGTGSLLGVPALSGLGGAAGTTLSAATLPLTFGNIYNAFDAEDPRAAAGGYGSLAGLGIGAGLGALVGGPAWPVTMMAGAGIGGSAGGAIGNAIGSSLPTPHSMAVRHHAGEVATDAVNDYMYGLQKAGSNGDLLGIQQALARPRADGRVTVSLNLPRSVAAAIGVPPQVGIGDLTPEQFVMALKAFSEHDGVNEGWFQGTGEVPYLQHDEGAKKVADAVSGIAHNAFRTMAQAYAPQLAQIPSVAPLTWEDMGGGYRMAPQLDYGVRSNDVGPLQPLSYEDARGYLGNTALRGGGVPLTASNPVGFGGGGDSVSMALRQLGQAPVERAPQMSPTQPFSTDWAGQRAGYQASLDDLFFDAQKRVSDLYQQQIREAQAAF